MGSKMVSFSLHLCLILTCPDPHLCLTMAPPLFVYLRLLSFPPLPDCLWCQTNSVQLAVSLCVVWRQVETAWEKKEPDKLHSSNLGRREFLLLARKWLFYLK